MLAKNNARITYRVECNTCGKELIREKYRKSFNYKCEDCKKLSQIERNNRYNELNKPKSIWDIKLENYKLTKSIYGRRSD